MLEHLLLHDQTKSHLQSIINDPPHALLIVGSNGIGKLTVATSWAAQIAPLVEVVEPNEKGTISIDQVRELYKRTRSKRDGHQVIIVDHAETMGTDAQNAFLKLLEEPRPGVTFVLTAPSPDTLLATIISRTQVLQINPTATTQLASWAKQLKPSISDQELTQLLFVAQGRPAILRRLLTEDGDFDGHKQVMQHAKQLLTATKYERLAQINELIKDRPRLVATLEAMAQMTKLQLQKGTEARWLRLAEGLQECLSRLAQNANPRAQLLRLFMLF
jgi:DNA polymerase III delta prime subunit